MKTKVREQSDGSVCLSFRGTEGGRVKEPWRSYVPSTAKHSLRDEFPTGWRWRLQQHTLQRGGSPLCPQLWPLQTPGCMLAMPRRTQQGKAGPAHRLEEKANRLECEHGQTSLPLHERSIHQSILKQGNRYEVVCIYKGFCIFKFKANFRGKKGQQSLFLFLLMQSSSWESRFGMEQLHKYGISCTWL